MSEVSDKRRLRARAESGLEETPQRHAQRWELLAVGDHDLDEAAHYSRYAFAAYGYLLYIWSQPQYKCVLPCGVLRFGAGGFAALLVHLAKKGKAASGSAFPGLCANETSLQAASLEIAVVIGSPIWHLSFQRPSLSGTSCWTNQCECETRETSETSALGLSLVHHPAYSFLRCHRQLEV